MSDWIQATSLLQEILIIVGLTVGSLGVALPIIHYVQQRSRRNLWEGTRLMSEENKQIARRSLEEIVNQHNPDAIDKFYAPDAVWHVTDQDYQSLEQAKQVFSTFFQAFPDVNVSVEDAIAEEDKVVTLYTIRGTHYGETEEYGSPTGRPIELKGMTIHRFREGMIAEDSDCYDNMSFLQQLGRFPE